MTVQEKVDNLLKRYLLTALGFFFLAVGLVALLLPVIPTTPFLILAAYFFNNGSSRFHFWLVNHPWFGPAIADWNRNRSIAPWHKIAFSSMLAVSGALSLLADRVSLAARLTYAGLAAAAIVYVLTRPGR